MDNMAQKGGTKMDKCCHKCGSTFIQTRYGYSQGDQLGEMYEYEFCIICGSVKQLINHAEHMAQVRDTIDRVGSKLDVTLATHRA